MTGLLLASGALFVGYMIWEETEPGKPLRNAIDILSGNIPAPPQTQEETSMMGRRY